MSKSHAIGAAMRQFLIDLKKDEDFVKHKTNAVYDKYGSSYGVIISAYKRYILQIDTSQNLITNHFKTPSSNK